ncbi:MAG: RagB/SusD family nutrient uptake outer membrane protein [Bacteroidaceae bacterium]|nr:RagB/SusD family nutrient uptake outer membrane protein [Bacteroidaceae bacterium]
MKNYIKYSIMGLTAVAALTATSCGDILDEQPRSSYDPSFFSTEKGVEGGLTSLYAHTRYFFGQYYYAYQENGTDEYTWGQSADGNFKDNDYDESGNVNPSSCRADAMWGVCFSNINTANGIIENAASTGLSESLVAEAHFFRAFDYFHLVQAYGGVPLDLGSGELKFNTTAARTSVRNTVAEVYTKCIFPDLELAVDKLPETPRKTGALTKNVARLFLAKAYLTYGWWLENPKKIDTYPACERNAADAKTYFEKAYNTAKAAIDNKGVYDLMPTYYEAHLGANDHNKEQMLYADHTEKSEEYDAQNHGYASGGAPDNFCVWFATCNYTDLRNGDGTISTVQREAAQAYGRPWTRMAPTHEVFSKYFADERDSRRDATFVLTFRANFNRAGVPAKEVVNANGMNIKEGDAALSFEFNDAVNYTSNTKNNVGAGEVPGRSDFVVNLKDFNRRLYPNLWKLGTYRTDNNGGMGSPNGAITRPFVIAKFSELYLIAAEAAVKLNNQTNAHDMLKPLRERAGKWSYSQNGGQPLVVDYSQALVDAMPATITIDYVLDERMRELYGECMRRNDLIRTQTWEERATTYTQCGVNYSDHSPQTFTRKIEKKHWLSPIPQGQIDALVMTEDERVAYQNPGYVVK